MAPGRAAHAWGGSGAAPTPPAPPATTAVPAPPGAAVPAPAAAAPDVEGRMRPEAGALYKRGLERFGARDYAGAVADLEAGYAIDPRREFLFAEGQAKRLAGDCKGAVALYQRFLATNPSSVQANATQMALGRCAQHLAEHPDVVVVEPPRPPPVPPPPPPIWWHDQWGLAASGIGAAAVGVGGGFVVAAYSARSDARAAPTYPEANERWEAAASRRTTGVVAIGAGAALVAAGAYRFLTVKRAQDRTPGATHRD